MSDGGDGADGAKCGGTNAAPTYSTYGGGI